MTAFNFVVYQLPDLPTTTVVPPPSDEVTFVQYFMRLYEDISSSVNAKDFNFFTIPISDVATNIPNLPNFGAYIVCVSGEDTDAPVKTWSLVKAQDTAAGVINVLGTQAGTNAWAGNDLTITSTATNFQIAHNRAGVTANFNIRIIGTQRG
jgi:hypothetical protein